MEMRWLSMGEDMGKSRMDKHNPRESSTLKDSMGSIRWATGSLQDYSAHSDALYTFKLRA